jgi:mannose-6-phosphate isomerase-like protein (cupin superfamily)
MSYVLTAPSAPSFVMKGLKGYQFGPLKNDELDIYFIEVEKGHDTFIISKKLTRIYYILEGTGYFIIKNQRYEVAPGMLVEIPPNVEYTYSGKMKIFSVSCPRWFKGNEEVTRMNPDVVKRLSPGSFLSKIRLKINKILSEQ